MEKLLAGGVGVDLEITTFCEVDGKVPNSTYTYHNLNIYGGGTLRFDDAKIDFTLNQSWLRLRAA
jgi:hypothetical protein